MSTAETTSTAAAASPAGAGRPTPSNGSRFVGWASNYIDERTSISTAVKTLGRKIEGGPYYTVKLTFATVLTMGGIRVNDKCQVVDAYGKAIPGLYAAGETTGGVHGNMYMGGCAIAWAFTSGWSTSCANWAPRTWPC